jgi:hypothetical protein
VPCRDLLPGLMPQPGGHQACRNAT